MTPNVSFRTLQTLIAAAALVALTGCSVLMPKSTVAQTDASRTAGAPEQSADTDERAEDARLALPPYELTGDVLFQFLMAEIAAQRGNGVVAASMYLDLARKTQDPRIARRATEIALFGRQTDSALECARLWVSLDPESARGRQILSGLLVAKNRVDELQPHLEKMLAAENTRIGDGLTRLNRVLGRMSDKAAVFRLVERVTEPYLKVPEARLARAQAAFGAGMNERALSEVETALDARPDWDQAVLQKAVILQATSPAKMLDWLDGYLRRHPEARDVRLHYARALVNDKRYEEARTQFEKLLAGSRGNPEVVYAVALLSMQLKDFDAAQVYLTRLLGMGWSDAGQVRLYLGQIAEERKELDQAMKWYGEVERGEHYLPARLRSAQVLARQGRLAEARSFLQRTEVSGAREEFQLLQLEAQLLRDAGKPEEAFDLLEARLKAQPDNTELLYDSAMLAERLGKLDLMETRLRRLIQLKPDHAHSYNALGYSLADRGVRLDEARSLIKRALELAPDDAFIIDSMGWVLYRQGELQAALAQLQRAHALRPDPEIAAHLGEVLWMLGRKDEANRTWDEAVKGSPGNEALVNAIRKFRK